MKTSKVNPVRLCLLLILSGWIATFGLGYIFMKEIKLTNGKSTFVDDEDFDYLSKWNWQHYKGRNTFYVNRAINNRGDQIRFSMHRVIMGLTDPKIICDHKDGNGLNNQKCNLRICNHSQNGANKLKRKGSKGTKYIGVYLRKDTKKWQAQVMKDYKHISFGCFNTDKEAAIAYNEGAKKLHGEFAVLNQIPS